jgi:CBS domain-containing protein
MKAREIMTRNPEALTGDASLEEAARLMRDRDVGFIPVVDDRVSMRLQGVITDRDIAVRHVADGHNGECCVSDHMSVGVTSVRPDDNLDQVMRLMKNEQIRRLPVCEDGDRLVGIISQADLAVDAGDTEATGRTVRAISEPAEPRR